MKIWIVGAGNIAKEYAKVLNALNKEYVVIGRGHKSAEAFNEMFGVMPFVGGLDAFLKTNPEKPEAAIITTNIDQLSSNAIQLMKYGVCKIFVEKPGFCFEDEIFEVKKVAAETQSEVYIAYNRRFYSSVLAAEKIIEEDGGVKSFNFEFTEWSHTISENDFALPVLNNWVYGNSSHVIDLAFFMGGMPTTLNCVTAGEIAWHKPAIFAGSGITDKGALFSYQANWAAPGRWSVEMLTSKHRIHLRPMEKLQVQNIGSVAINPVEIDDHLDTEFKPGFYLQTKAFLEADYTRLCSIEEQFHHVTGIYGKILGK